MKDYNWPDIVKDIISELHVSQTQLADRCRVTQQTVSNWKTGTRKPGIYAQAKLMELAQDAKLQFSDYLSALNFNEVCPTDQVRDCFKGLNHAQQKIAVHVLLTLTEDFRQQNSSER